MTQIRIVNKSGHDLPSYATVGAAGMDLRANLDKPVTIKPLGRALIPTGLFMEIPEGCEVQIRPRSGLAYKHGITVLNTPGTIDCDYRGEVGVLLVNLSDEPFTVQHGERIAQMVVAKYEKVELTGAEMLTGTNRGSGGFGSTGKK